MEENGGQGVSKRRLREELGWNNDKITRGLNEALIMKVVEQSTEGGQPVYRRVR